MKFPWILSIIALTVLTACGSMPLKLYHPRRGQRTRNRSLADGAS